jgi:cell division transport system ATP-binding protein
VERKPLVVFRDATILNGEMPVVYGLEMTILPGELVYVVGRVGTGKTSIIRTMIAENALDAGTAEVCGYALQKLRKRDIPYLRRKVGVVFQDFQLLMDRTVKDNLSFVLRATGWRDSARIERRITEVLKGVGMETKAHRMPHQLSGGEQQRIAIARALLNSPDLLIADEPTGNLDEETAEGILQLLRRINIENNTAIVMVTHNKSIVQRYPGRVFVCAGERCTELGGGDLMRIGDEDF